MRVAKVLRILSGLEDTRVVDAVTLLRGDHAGRAGGLTAREATEMVGVSASGMKSRVQRGRTHPRGFQSVLRSTGMAKVIDYTLRALDYTACK